MMKKRISGMFLLLVLVCSVVYADNINGITINFVPMVNDGYGADGNGYGAVGYHYRIGTREITIDQFAASPISDANANYWNDGVRNVGSDAPVVNITWYQAAQYCNWLTSGNVSNGAYTVSGGLVTGVTDHDGAAMDSLVATFGQVYVLPTEDEWYRAAYYKDESYSLYANGSGTAPTHGSDANFSSPGGYFNGPAWTVGSGTNEQNGTKNMMGNVWEWLESADDGTLDNLGSENVAVRGGDYFQGVDKLDSAHRGIGELPNNEFLNTGIRVVAIPEPGTMSMMSLSTVGLFMTRSIRRRRRLGQTLLPVRREYLCDTFNSECEWNVGVEGENDAYLTELLSVLKDGCVKLWSEVVRMHQSIDKAFWNRMVVVHERKIARRIELRQTLRKRALDGFDAFLALIMK